MPAEPPGAAPDPLKRPFVTLSWAQGLDGSIAAAPGVRSRLSGPESMRMTHALRSRHEGILVGIGTLLSDNPSLSVRLVEGRSPRPVVLDADLRTWPDAKVLAEVGRRAIIFGAKSSRAGLAGTEKGKEGYPRGSAPPRLDAARRHEAARRLEEAGATLIFVDRDKDGGLDLRQVLAALREEGMTSLMVEGGARVLASFLAARLVDEIVVTIAPTILGGLAPFATTTPFASGDPSAMPSTSSWLPCSLADSRIEILGADVLISGRPMWPEGPSGSPRG